MFKGSARLDILRSMCPKNNIIIFLCESEIMLKIINNIYQKQKIANNSSCNYYY